MKRNEPCYCGSGKKYKQCHLKIDQEKAKEERAWESAAQFLRRDLIRFAREERFAVGFAQGLETFFNKLYNIENAAEMSEMESIRYIEWFTFDYSPDRDYRLIDEYCKEKLEIMDEMETALLEGWAAAPPMNAYRLVESTGENKQVLELQNIFDETELRVDRSTGPGQASEGDVLIARPQPYRDDTRMSMATGYLPAEDADELVQFVTQEWETYHKDNPDAEWDNFLVRHTHLFAHYELMAAEKAGRPAVARLDPKYIPSKVARVTKKVRKFRK